MSDHPQYAHPWSTQAIGAVKTIDDFDAWLARIEISQPIPDTKMDERLLWNFTHRIGCLFECISFEQHKRAIASLPLVILTDLDQSNGSLMKTLANRYLRGDMSKPAKPITFDHLCWAISRIPESGIRGAAAVALGAMSDKEVPVEATYELLAALFDMPAGHRAKEQISASRLAELSVFLKQDADGHIKLFRLLLAHCPASVIDEILIHALAKGPELVYYTDRGRTAYHVMDNFDVRPETICKAGLGDECVSNPPLFIVVVELMKKGRDCDVKTIPNLAELVIVPHGKLGTLVHYLLRVFGAGWGQISYDYYRYVIRFSVPWIERYPTQLLDEKNRIHLRVAMERSMRSELEWAYPRILWAASCDLSLLASVVYSLTGGMENAPRWLRRMVEETLQVSLDEMARTLMGDATRTMMDGEVEHPSESLVCGVMSVLVAQCGLCAYRLRDVE